MPTKSNIPALVKEKNYQFIDDGVAKIHVDKKIVFVIVAAENRAGVTQR